MGEDIDMFYSSVSAGPATYLSSTGSLVGSANVWQSLVDEGFGTTLLSRVGPTQHCALGAWMA